MVKSRNLGHDQLDYAKAEPIYTSNPVASDSNSDNLAIGPRSTYISTGAAAGLTQEHRDYLIKRHGTLDLEPVSKFKCKRHPPQVSRRFRASSQERTDRSNGEVSTCSQKVKTLERPLRIHFTVLRTMPGLCPLRNHIRHKLTLLPFAF